MDLLLSLRPQSFTFTEIANMKKVYLLAFLALTVFGGAYAQESTGGFPLSSTIVKVQDQKVAHIELPAPDYTAIIQQNDDRAAKGFKEPYKIAQLVASDISLSNSGTWSYLDDGSKIWRLSVSVSGAKAIGLYYDHFQLPKGVKLFVSNENGRQTLGAYTAANNNAEFNVFANEPVQGSVANIEMNIPAGISEADIIFHINDVAAYYRGVGPLNQTYSGGSTSTPARPTAGNSAPCNVDANCPLPPFAPSDYHIAKNASVQITIRNTSGNDLGSCSGTLINNTGNVENGTCVPYLLTASHCDDENSFDDAHYSQWLFRFNYRYDSCGGNTIADPSGIHSTMIGATFKARSYFPSMSSPSGAPLKLVGDFLLLQLNGQPAETLGTFLNGWNRNLDLASSSNYYDFFIGFHYPRGDVEKQSIGYSIQSNGTFNQNQVHATHWYIPFAIGGTQKGSSGSGLFDVDGRLVGDLSGGSSSGCQNNPAFSDFGKEGLYSKISYNWDNDYDQSNHPRPAGQEKQSRLKDWLDPSNTGMMKLNSLTPDCKPLAGIHQMSEEMGNNIEIFPTPSTTGVIHAKTNFNTPTNMSVAVYNSLGRIVKTFSLNGAYNGNYSFDCSGLANGMYIMKFVGDNAIATKKILIAR